MDGLRSIDSSLIREVRGLGLMVGPQLKARAGSYLAALARPVDGLGVLALQPDGVLVSNGPGDRAVLDQTITSRTVPYVSKAIGIPAAKLAARIPLGRSLQEVLAPYWPYPTVNLTGRESRVTLDEILDAIHLAPTPWPERAAVKEVVLPFGRFPGSDVVLGPEMRSTGEVMSFGENFPDSG